MSEDRIDNLRKKLDSFTTDLGRQRDKLEELIGEAEDLADSMDRALEALGVAKDALSELA